MAKKIIKLKIDVKKIDKARLYQGANGTYLDATFFCDDEPGKFGDNGMIVQDVSKEERQAGVKGAILGNGKIIQQAQTVHAEVIPDPAGSDLPF